MRNLLILISLILMMSCSQKEKVDLIVYNAKVYTVDESNRIAEAFAVKDSRFVAVGKSSEILDAYQADVVKDLDAQFVYPGLYDAHCHFYGYGMLKVSQADLSGTTSFEEVLEILLKHAADYPAEWVRGRGWDQNDWEVKEFPTRKRLDEIFPDKAVYLTRIDGHAALVNSKALELGGINEQTKVDGGELIKKDGKLTGVLVDNAMDLLKDVIPDPSDEIISKALLKAQLDCFAYGLTSVADAGLKYDLVQTIMEMQESGELKMRIYAMLLPEEDNMEKIVKNGPLLTDHLSIRSIKVFSDGALGSRGAKLIEPYHDKPSANGLLLIDYDSLKAICSVAYKNNFQVNTHAIGDSANRMLLDLYADFLGENNDLRWRIEHAQVIHPDDFHRFGKYAIVPSVQPTHATSDMYWAGERLGEKRLKSAYAYKQLLDENAWLPLGTDFPVEQVNPMLTFYAAVARKDVHAYPEGGFQMENAISRDDALRGMTIWAAKAAFEEHNKGSIEKGKLADFVVFEEDLMSIHPDKIPALKVLETYLGGEQVFKR